MPLPLISELCSQSPLSAVLSHHRHHPPPMIAAAAAANAIATSTSFRCHTSHLPLRRPLRRPHRRPIHLPLLSFLPNRAASITTDDPPDPEMTPHFVEQFPGISAEKDMKHLSAPELETKELEDLPEQWRRTKIAWLCKELPQQKPAGIIKLLNAQRKWITQEDATYVALHCMRIRENESAFRVYQWMVRQRWFCFDFAFATKLADFLGKERKYAKCREMFDGIVRQGRVPSESTFHILIVAYLSTPVEGCVEEACGIYNKMIQLGGYRPRLSLHNSLFRALVSGIGAQSKHFLKQAEFIYHNLVTSELEVHKDIYAGLIWLHSYQDIIDRERIVALREEMRQKGFEESKDVLLSVIRSSSKEGDVDETERTWLKLLKSGENLPSQAFVYRMELYAKVKEPMKSLEIFRGMKKLDVQQNTAAYHKIIEVMSKAKEIEIAETLMEELIESDRKPLNPAFIDLMNMYLNLDEHDKLELTFSKCLVKSHPNRSIYNIYLESLVRRGNLAKAEEIFNKMHADAMVGINARSCNTILGGYLSSDEYEKAEKIYDMICHKKYDIEAHYLEKLEYALSLKKKVVKRRVSMKIDQEQREILIGMLLAGLQIESDEKRKNHAVHFEFNKESSVHSVLRLHIHDQFYEWLNSSSRLADGDDDIPYWFCTVAHSHFGFFADQFYLNGRSVIPKLIHRWLSERVLAYWYMYGGFRISSGDIVLKLKGGTQEDVKRIAIAFQEKSLTCRVKRKGRVSWIGFQGSNAVSFWKLIESYVLENTKDLLAPNGMAVINGTVKEQSFGFETQSDSDEQRLNETQSDSDEQRLNETQSDSDEQRLN